MSKIEHIAPHELIIVGLDTEDREDHPLFDERVFLPINEALIKNILVYGIQQPVIVRREVGRYFVVDGRQRVRAAREAASRQGAGGEYQVKVPVKETRADDQRIAGIMISTNELREGDETLTKALKAVRLMDLVGDIHEVAIAFGRSPTQIRNWFTLAEADSSVHAAIRTGAISASAAIELSRYPREEQMKALSRAITAAAGKQVSEARAKTDRQQQGHSSAAGASNATAASKNTTNTQSRSQAGIKRTWIRSALKTNTAKALTAEQRALLTWFSTGEGGDGTWYDDFLMDAQEEMAKKKAGRKKK